MNFQIESGVAIPEMRTFSAAEPVYPTHLLEPTQSFFVGLPEGIAPDTEAGNAEVVKIARRVRNNVTRVAKQLGRKFTVRSFSDGVRVWRVS